MKYHFAITLACIVLAGTVPLHAQSMSKPPKPGAMADSQQTSMVQDSAKQGMKSKADAMGKTSDNEMKKPMAKDSSMMKKPQR